MKRNRKNLMILMAVVLVLSMFFTGCRPSPVLMQKIYTSDAKEIDRDLLQKKPDEDGQKDEDFHETEPNDEDANQNDVEYSAGQQQEDGSDGASKDLKYNQNAENKGPATDQKQPNQNKPEETTPPETTEPEAETEESESEEESGEDSGDEGDEDEKETEDGAPKKDVTDDSGEVQKVPEEVEKVTAVGYAAQLVEMLGGSGRLMACDSDFAYNSLAGTVCPDLSSGEVETWWEGNGSEPIDDYSFEYLLEEKPDICFEISGQDTFTSAQVKELKKAGIAYLTLPKLKTSKDLVDAAYIVAECLEENHDSGKSAISIARKYEDWIADVKSDVSSSKKRYSVYITEWRDDIGYSFQSRLNYAALPVDQGGMGYGVAIAWSPKKSELVTEFMKAAGVTNESTANSSFNKTNGVYVAPMFHQFSAQFDNNAYTYFTKNIATSYDWFLVHNYGGNSSPALLGSQEYPGIIVADSNIKYAIESSWYWEYHGVFDLGDVVIRAGYVNEETGDIFSSSIIGDYDIHVNPYGLGDWAEGSVDFPLEAYFVGNTITGSVSDTSLKSAVKSFYQKFFNTALDASEVEMILEGR